MSIVIKDRVKETTTIVGTGPILLDGAQTGYQAFSIIGNGNKTFYCIADQIGSNWEVGIGTYNSSINSISRDTVLASNNNGSLVFFSAGLKDVFITYPSENALYVDELGDSSISGLFTSGSLSTGNLAYTGTLTGATGVINIGSNQIYKDASGNVGIGKVPSVLLDVNGFINAGNMQTGTGVSTGGAFIELGGLRTGAGISYIDFHSTSGTDYETRVARNANVNGSFDLLNTGTGGIAITQVGAGPIVFSVSNTEKARFDSSGYLLVGTTTASGTNLLQVNSDALINGLTVGRGLASVSTNTAFGVSALSSITTGNFNTAFGYQALRFNDSAAQNTAFGNGAMNSTTSGGLNCAFGSNALAANTTGIQNNAVGLNSLANNTTGAVNCAFGYFALQQNTIGSSNSAFGRFSLFSATTSVATLGTITGGSGYTNGTYTGVVMTLSSGSTAVTYPTATIVVSGGAVTSVTITSPGSAFKDTTTVLTAPAASIGGTGSGFSVPVATLSTANNNTAFGDLALRFLVNGSLNTAVGVAAGTSLTGASINTFIGYNAGASVTTGSNNVILGSYTGAAAPISATGSNYIVLADGAANIRQVIDSSGNTGFGTTAPSTTLSVASVGGSQKRALFISSGNGAGSAGGVYITSATPTGGNGAVYEAIGQRSDGNGSAQFSGTTALGRLRTDVAISTSGITLGRMTFGGNPTGTALSNILYSAQIAGVSDTAWSSSTAMGTALAFYTGATGIDINSVLGDAGTEAMRISSAGNLGIGNTAPGTKLDVSGVTRSTTFSVGASGGTAAFGAGTISTDANWGMYFRANTGATSAEFAFVNGAGTERMRITPTGNLAIGATSANVKLEVSSTDAILIPKGTIAQRPTGVSGYVRFNTDSGVFEGHNGSTWAGLGGSAGITSGTAVATTSGTAIDFTGIPAGAKRITVIFNEVSIAGTGTNLLIQIGSGSVTTTGYTSTAGTFAAGPSTGITPTAIGFNMNVTTIGEVASGIMTICLVGSNLWVSSHSIKTGTAAVGNGGGSITLAGALDRVRLTTINGTSTFDNGSVNIFWE